MNKGTYQATQGMVFEAMRMDIIANNLANLNSTGFKRSQLHVTSFEGHLNQVAPPQVDTTPPDRPKDTKLPTAMVARYHIDLQEGAIHQTREPLDLAIKGSGFFGVLDHEGSISYTRDGAFTLNDQGDLVTQTGLPVLDLDEQPLNIGTVSQIAIDENGKVFGDQQLIGQLLVKDFPADSLQQTGHNLFRILGSENNDSGGPATDFKIVQGFLESSNANPIREMVRMIETLRNFQGYQKTIQAFNDSVQQINETARS